MSLLTLSKKILGKDAKKAPARNKKVKSAAAAAKTKKQAVDVHALSTGAIGLSEVVSEKGILQQGNNTVVFRVLPHVTKHQIAAVIEARYGVKVLSVRTSVLHPKIRRRGISEGMTKRWKKAYVTVDNVQALAAV